MSGARLPKSRLSDRLRKALDEYRSVRNNVLLDNAYNVGDERTASEHARQIRRARNAAVAVAEALDIVTT
jgi:hypothetical protein